jgi:ubiquinone biosynthesis protein UbiJ
VHYVRPETMEAYRIRSVEKRSKLEELRFQLLSSLERAEKDVEASFSTIIEDSLSSFDREALTAVNTAAHRRLKEIRLYASKATNLRKQKIQQYGEEVAQLVSDVKGSTRRLTMLRA